MGLFAEDMARYRTKGLTTIDLWLNPAVWSIATYRLGHYAFTGQAHTLIRLPLKILASVLLKFCVVFMEMDIDPQATIGGGFYIAHIGGIHINPSAVLGRNCDVAHRTTIGASAMGRSGIPIIGDNVYIGTGAVLVGKIRVGNGAKIAANTLVMSNVPAGATVMGVPGRIILRPRPAAIVAAPPDAPLPTEIPGGSRHAV